MAFKAGAIYGEAILDTKKWNSGLKTLTKGTGAAMAAVGAAIVGGMGVAVAQANAFQKEMSNVSTVIDTTQISTQGLTKSLLQLDPSLGNTTELTNGLYQSFSAGARTAEEAMQTTADAAKFGKAALTDTNTAVDILTTAVNAYGRETMDTTKASDLFFTTIKQGKITGEELSGVIGQSIPLFASTGIEMEELTAGIAAMTKQGVQASETTTQLNAIVNAFIKPTSELSEAMEELGYSSGSAFLEAEGLSGALKLVEDQSGGSADKMGELLPNIRALRGAMALTGTGGEEFSNILGEMENAAGATDEAFEKQEKTFATLQASLGKVAIVTGNIGKHFVDEMAAGATEATEGMLKFIMSSSGMEIVSEIIGQGAGIFNLLKEAITPIVETLVPELQNLWDTLTGTFDEIFGKTEKGAGSFQLLAVASNLVSSGITIISKVMQGAITNIGNLIMAINESAQTLGTFFEFLGGKKTWQEVKEQASGAGDAFKEFGQDFGQSFVDVINTTRDEMKNFNSETEELTANLSASYETSYNNTTAMVERSWGKMITGQEDFTGQLIDNINGVTIANEEANNEQGKDNEDATKKWKEEWKERADGVAEYVNLATNSISSLNDQLFNIESMGIQNRMDREELAYQKRVENLDNMLEQNMITQEEYDAALEEAETQKNEKMNALGEKAFEAEKKNKLANLFINTASAIMGWWQAAPTLGPIAGPAFASIMTSLTLGMAGKQASLISEQQYIPAYESGGMASGVSRVNESGGEIISLPDGSQVIPNDISRQIAESSGGMSHTVININNPSVRSDRDIDRLVSEIDRRLGRRLRTA